MNVHSSHDKTAPPASPDSGPEHGSEAGAPPTAEFPPVREIGGRRDGTDPTRFGDWEKGGRCIDF